MLTEKGWKSDAVMRLLISIFLCLFGGSLIVTAAQYEGWGTSRAPAFAALMAGAFIFLVVTLVRLRMQWRMETFTRQLVWVFVCFYLALSLGAWAQKLAGPVKSSPLQMSVAALSFQGATIVLLFFFLHEHRTTWSQAFGFRLSWGMALLLGVLAGFLFLPVAQQLQRITVAALEHLPQIGWRPEEQQSVQTLREVSQTSYRVGLGVVTVLLAPVGEELLFRGILYPWVREWGFPRLALWGTSIVFAGVHLNLITFVPLALFSILLIELYRRTGNLLASITAHATFNALNFAGLYLMS